MTTIHTKELVGLGAGMEIPEEISTDKVWAVLQIKIQQPNLFLPVTVTDVVTRPIEEDGKYREMSMVSFNETDDQDDEDEHVNAILVDNNGKRTLEFFKRNSVTKERVEWAVPKQMVVTGIVKVFDMARTI